MSETQKQSYTKELQQVDGVASLTKTRYTQDSNAKSWIRQKNGRKEKMKVTTALGSSLGGLMRN